MNRYPTEFAPRSWGPRLSPWLVRLCAPIRRYKQSRETGLVQVDVRGVDRLQSALNSRNRLLIAPNHSSHADDLFVVTQLFSYPGDYLRTQNPSLERIAETVDKLEEDVLQRHTASIRGRRTAVVEFGSPIPISAAKSRTVVNELTATVQLHVQGLLDQMD